MTTFGESHGPAIGCVVDGCPSLLPISLEEIQRECNRRVPGQSKIVTQRKEQDQIEILSGIHEGLTLGTPIAIMTRNQDVRTKDYDELREKFRPSHADLTYQIKYGIRAWSGGGRASARETFARVAAGAIAQKLLNKFGIQVVSWVSSVGDIESKAEPLKITREMVDSHIVRCPHRETAEEMLGLIESVRKNGDTIGGSVSCCIQGCPAGLGEPIFDKLEADLAKAMLSIPASKGFEIGSGFRGTKLRGSEHNDPYRAKEGHVYTTSNHSGGIQGGISNGMPILFSVAFKPVATIVQEQETIDTNFKETTIKGRGRHDPCVLPRAVPIVDAMAALVLVDHLLGSRLTRA